MTSGSGHRAVPAGRWGGGAVGRWGGGAVGRHGGCVEDVAPAGAARSAQHREGNERTEQQDAGEGDPADRSEGEDDAGHQHRARDPVGDGSTRVEQHQVGAA
ncbi:hypothetical protein OG369_35550 [Streptomyces sp. NBC_01221]|uniref:hypothetical protein n=1 Tax=Streptomyces sp. NBC_01221 TaxID=2903782 RepID=UPI00225A1E50|nr:hypothetical protein [Streptomyces sp. NBC_01221]MCX4791276.1 hypothetical protein [Streptomyces sp. NBC_01221]